MSTRTCGDTVVATGLTVRLQYPTATYHIEISNMEYEGCSDRFRQLHLAATGPNLGISSDFSFEWSSGVISRYTELRRYTRPEGQQVQFIVSNIVYGSPTFFDVSVSEIVLRPSSTDIVFPTVTLGDSSTIFGVSLANVGPETVSVTGFRLSSDEFTLGRDFAQAVRETLELGPGSSRSFDLGFVPRGAGTRAGILTFEASTPLLSIALKGASRALRFDLSHTHSLGEIPQGEPLGFLASLPESVLADSIVVRYRPGGRSDFSRLELAPVQNGKNLQFLGSLPADSITARGVEFFAEASNGRVKFLSPLERRRVQVKHLLIPTARVPERYGLISFPLEIHDAALGIIVDDLGLPNVTAWRMFAYDPGDSAYVELPDDRYRTFEQSHAYWLVTRTPVQLNTAPGAGLSTPTDSVYTIQLRSGWNLVGNPFAFTVPWDSVRINGTLVSQQGIVEPPMRWDVLRRSYESDVTEIAPFQGYWILNRADSMTALTLPPVEARAPMARKATSTGWSMQMTVSSEGALDENNVAGILDDASTGRDRFDRADPPSNPGTWISLYFPHLAWEERQAYYATDFSGLEAEGTLGDEVKLAPEPGHVFQFDVAKGFSTLPQGDPVTISFREVGQQTSVGRVLLVDRHLARVIDLRQEGTYSFCLGRKGFVARDSDARFALLVGTGLFAARAREQLVRLPQTSRLYPTSPNPFSSSTLIRYDLAEAGRVQLRVFDVRGALVRVLQAGDRAAGGSELVWDGRNSAGARLGSGVYFLELKTSRSVESQKILVAR